MNQVYTLSDGVVISTSTRGVTGYLYAAFSPSWTLNAAKPFISARGNPTDDAVMALVTAQERTSLHLGHYADAREAAYVGARFEIHPEDTLAYVQRNGSWDKFPADLYSLPPALMSAEDAVVAHAAYKAGKSKSKIVAKDRNILATETSALTNNFGRPAVVALAQKLGGAEFLQSAIKGKTIQQVADEYELAMI